MLRRPPGHKCSLAVVALALLGLPWLPIVDAQQQQGHSQPRSPPESDHDARHVTVRTALTAQTVESPMSRERRKNTLADSEIFHQVHNPTPDDESARAVAPADKAVRAPSFRHNPSPRGLGLYPQPGARSLEDWEVEDFVLLATVDGDLYATDRKTGKVRWHLEVEQPMVETKHFRSNNSVLNEDYDPVDHYLWVVEPNRNGGLYLLVPNDDPENAVGPSIFPMTYTVKEMVDNSPYFDKDKNIKYTGDKKTRLVTMNAATGQVVGWFGTGEDNISELLCSKPNGLPDTESEECSNSATITLGRTEYIVTIKRGDGRLIASLKYSEWGPTTADNDLIRQHRDTSDHCYVATQHDGSVYGFDFSRHFDNEDPTFAQKFASPVARVFDILSRATPGSDSDLRALPQPPPPEHAMDRREGVDHVFINRTAGGSWYALPGERYPLIIQAPAAPVHTSSSFEMWETMDEAEISKALIGRHRLPGNIEDPRTGRIWRPSLPGPLDSLPAEPSDPGSQVGGGVEASEPSPSLPGDYMKRLPGMASDKVIDLVSNPLAILIGFICLFVFQKDLRRWWNSANKAEQYQKPHVQVEKSGEDASISAEARQEEEEEDKEPLKLKAEQKKEAGEPLMNEVEAEVKKQIVDDATPQTDEAALASATSTAVDNATAVDDTSDDASGPGEGRAASSVTFAEAAENLDKSEGDTPPPENGKSKKKAHRGRRGGQKHKKGKDRRDTSLSREDDPPQPTLDEAVKKAQNLGDRPRLEPDILTVTNDVEEVSGPVLKMGSLEVNMEQQLGTGSNGTVVFAGKWDGRDVAVKRMLVQFNEIASQETRLLRESDDHPNVIRYFAQQERAAFLYIALELCQASLADVVQKPQMFRDLAQAGERDMPGVLYQVANGLSHLHNLRIVHRDLKPQNILVNMGKDGKARVLVSDFGLCKKLEGGQSSFGATTAHAAGTSGWRAPELLLDDDVPDHSVGMTTDPGSSLHSTSTGSALVDSGAMGPNTRRVTRAIDIFSLGLVFFYVLTKGSHPFDCGDRYMREVNIRKGKYSLQPLDVLGDFAFEARDLIQSMLSALPKDRPSARDVMAHPFFWSAKKRLSFLCDVSDHFEKEPRDPPSDALQELERWAPDVVNGDFLKHLPKEFVDSLGKQRKYTGTRLLDLLRALRNKKNHYEDMTDSLKKAVGPLPDGYLGFWARRFPNLLIACWNIVYNCQWEDEDRFKEYYVPAKI